MDQLISACIVYWEIEKTSPYVHNTVVLTAEMDVLTVKRNIITFNKRKGLSAIDNY